MRSPSRRASASRFSTTTPNPSPRIVPSPTALNGRLLPVGESAGVLLKHMYMKMSLNVSMPPVMAMSERPAYSSIAAMCRAASELAQAASTTQLRAADIKPIGDPPRRHVAKQTREGILLPGHVRIADALDHIFRDVRFHAGVFAALSARSDDRAVRRAGSPVPKPRSRRESRWCDRG